MLEMFGNRMCLFLRKVVPSSRRGYTPYCRGFEYVSTKNDDEHYKGSYASNLKYFFPSPTNSLEARIKDEADLQLTRINVTYPSGMKNCVRIVKGERLEEDVLTLLSNGGKRDYLVRNNGDKVSVDSLARKYVLICCFKVPLLRKSVAAHVCRSMISAYSQLVKNGNVEMVMVAKMATTAPLTEEEEEDAFRRFLDAFPCLAIPLWDAECRDFVCKSLGLIHHDKHFAALVVDPNQMVLQTEERKFFDYGVPGFPYSDDRLDAICKEDVELACRLDHFNWHDYQVKPVIKPGPVSLVELFGGSDVLLSRFGSSDKIRVSELSNKKCVALYLCLDGMCSGSLDYIRGGCLHYDLEFEVVLVYMPFLSDTTSYAKAVEAMAVRERYLSSWWVMPDGEAARRLWRIGYPWGLQRDEWLFVADGGYSGELCGRELQESVRGLWDRPFHELYPFSRMSILHNVLRRIRSVTLDLLLGTDNQLIHLSSDGWVSTVNVCELKGKNVLVYLDVHGAIIAGAGGSYCYRRLLHLYEQMQKDYPNNSQVVFVPLDDEEVPQRHTPAAVPWLALPHSAVELQGAVISRLFPDETVHPNIVAFGDDGRVRSVAAAHENDEDDNHSLFDDTLFQEIFDCLSEYNLAALQ